MRLYFIFKNILVVCLGNICRSPTAERIFQKKLPLARISSAGISAMVGHDMDRKSASLLEANGYNSEKHIARKLNAEEVFKADLVLVMEKSHQDFMIKHSPEYSGKIFLLGKWEKNINIHDPYRKSNEMFNYVFNQIEKNCTEWCAKLSK